LLFDESQLLVWDYKSDKLDRVKVVDFDAEANVEATVASTVEPILTTLAGEKSKGASPESNSGACAARKKY
jgi:hypothetical protein